jgi:hypothetical protein
MYPAKAGEHRAAFVVAQQVLQSFKHLVTAF